MPNGESSAAGGEPVRSWGLTPLPSSRETRKGWANPRQGWTTLVFLRRILSTSLIQIFW